MNSFVYTSVSGWVASILIGVDALLPYLLRRSRFSQLLGITQAYTTPYLRRMWPHYWAGYLLLALSVAHAWVPAQAGHLRRANMAGVWFATVALGLLLLQAVLGLVLQDSKLRARRLVRGWHYWMMIALAPLVTVHIWLNG